VTDEHTLYCTSPVSAGLFGTMCTDASSSTTFKPSFGSVGRLVAIAGGAPGARPRKGKGGFVVVSEKTRIIPHQNKDLAELSRFIGLAGFLKRQEVTVQDSFFFFSFFSFFHT
jgi:hypothetical protein